MRPSDSAAGAAICRSHVFPGLGPRGPVVHLRSTGRALGRVWPPSASSAAGDDGDAVSLAGDYVGRNNKRGQRRAVRLDEIGPRMELRLVKITEGIPGKEGEVLYHRFGE